MNYATWKLNFANPEYGTGPEDTIANLGFGAEGSWVAGVIENGGTILGYLTEPVEETKLAEQAKPVDGAAQSMRETILETEKFLKQTPEGTKKYHAVLGAMKVRLTSKQQPLDVIPEEQWEFYLRNLAAAAG
jgi:hypothetical protein